MIREIAGIALACLLGLAGLWLLELRDRAAAWAGFVEPWA